MNAVLRNLPISQHYAGYDFARSSTNGHERFAGDSLPGIDKLLTFPTAWLIFREIARLGLALYPFGGNGTGPRRSARSNTIPLNLNRQRRLWKE